jgi:hypothetical protein
MRKNDLLVFLESYFGDDLYAIFGDTIEDILKNAIDNYLLDDTISTDTINCVQSLDLLGLVAQFILKEIKNDKIL